MEARKRLTSRRALLPQDQQVIDTLGITRDEYYDFLDQCEYACRERGEEYSHVPNVVNGPITPVLVQVAIGIALTVAGALLAPKPKSPDEKKQLEPINTGDKTGKSKFTPYNDFDSVQELAALGTPVPLVYTNGTKGVRVNTQLLWSNIETISKAQVAKMLLLISQGTLGGKPGFGGIAIGDTLLENFDQARLRVWYNDGNGNKCDNPKQNNCDPKSKTREFGAARIKDRDYLIVDGKPVGNIRGMKVPNDVFTLKEYRNDKYYPWFSGARTPGTATEFGLFNTMPNGNHYKVSYELILVNDNTEQDVKQGQREKINKRDEEYPIGAGIIKIKNGKITTTSTSIKEVKVEVGDRIDYYISRAKTFGAYNGGRWGLDDVTNATAQRRSKADDTLALGKIYHIGSAQFVCIQQPAEVWELEDSDVVYRLECIDRGAIKFGGPRSDADNWKTFNLAEIGVGVITTNRPDDDIIEIGVKSTVWKRVSGFPNLNSQPSQSVIDEYSDGGGSITLGSMNTYLYRMSLFKIFIRPIDSNRWIDLIPGTAFCVKHNNPSEVFNSFRIELPGVTRETTEYEIQFMPVAGNYAISRYKSVVILDTRRGWNSYPTKAGGLGSFRLWYRGYTEQLSLANCSNREFIIGPQTDVGRITRLSPNSGGKIPDEDKETCNTEYYKRRPEKDSTPQSFVAFVGPQENRGGDRSWTYLYKGEVIKRLKGSSSDYPGEVKGKYKGRTYYFRRGKLKYDVGSRKYYEIVRCRKDQEELVKESRLVTPLGGSGKGAKIRYTTYKNGAWQAEIIEPGTGYRNNQRITLNVPGPNRSMKIRTNTDEIFKVNPWDMIKDYPVYDAETASNDSGPEHSLSYINEVRKDDGFPADYKDLSTLGLWLTSSVDITNVSQISVYVNRGIVGRTWTGAKSYSSISFLPEIIFDLLTNVEYGLGGIIGRRGVNEGEMAKTTHYCRANGFGWDGVIKDRINIRQWIYEQAAYIMCDFCITGGKFYIKPSFPLHSNHKIHSRSDMRTNKTVPVEVKALFTPGNTRNASVTFLPPEERQMFTAQVIYRNEEALGFPKLTTKTIGLVRKPEVGDQGGRDDDPIERFDMSAFCHSESHAEKFARYALRLRQLVTHTVKFQSTPESCRNLVPGDYVRYINTVTHLDRFATGSISDTGVVQSHWPAEKLEGTRIMYWKVGTNDGIRAGNLKLNADGRCPDDNMKGSVFAPTNQDTQSRIYKVESIQYSDEGLVDLTLNEAPVDARNRLLVLDWRDEDFYEYD